MARLRYVFGLLIVLLSISKVHAQVITSRPGADTMRVVNLINADRLSYLRPDSTTDLQMLAGNVQLKQDNTIFYCDSAVFNKKTRFIEAFGHVHINDNDSVHIRSQYLKYYVDTKMAYLKKNVTLTDAKSTLTTEDLQYDLNTKIGEYHNGGKVINQQSVLTSKEGTYYAEFKDVYFRHNVNLKDPKYQLKSDSLLYNTESQLATFIGPTDIVDSAKRTIKTSEGYYDLKNKKAFFGKRPTLTDGSLKIIANSIDSDDSTGVSKLRGNAVYIDTTQGISILANYMEANRDDGSFFATQHPLMIIKQDKDSIYITGDSMFSGRLSKLNSGRDTILTKDTINRKALVNVPVFRNPADTLDSARLTKLPGGMDTVVTKDTMAGKTLVRVPAFRNTTDTLDSVRLTKLPGRDTILTNDTVNRQTLATVPTIRNTVDSSKSANKSQAAKVANNKNDSADRYFQVYHRVRIFSDSMQAVCDSLWYSGKDSIFRLYTNPVLWASKSQITGDTIYMYTKNKNPDRLYVSENGLAINLSDSNMYNQIKGNRLHGYFTNGEIDYMRAQGNAESVFYVKDDKDALVGVNNAASDIIDIRFKNKELNKVVFISEVTGTMYPIKQASEQNRYLRGFKWLEERRPKTKFELFFDEVPTVPKPATEAPITPPVVNEP